MICQVLEGVSIILPAHQLVPHPILQHYNISIHNYFPVCQADYKVFWVH